MGAAFSSVISSHAAPAAASNGKPPGGQHAHGIDPGIAARRVDHRGEHHCDDDRHNRCDTTTRRHRQQQPKADRIDQFGRRRRMHHGRIHPPERLDEHARRSSGRARPSTAGTQRTRSTATARQVRMARVSRKARGRVRAPWCRPCFHSRQISASNQRAKRQQETDHLSCPGARDRHREQRSRTSIRITATSAAPDRAPCRHAIRLRSKARRDQCDAAAEQVEDTRQFEQERDSSRHAGKNKPVLPPAFESAQQRQRAERGKEQVEPRWHGRRVVRHRPHNSGDCPPMQHRLGARTAARSHTAPRPMAARTGTVECGAWTRYAIQSRKTPRADRPARRCRCRRNRGVAPVPPARARPPGRARLHRVGPTPG